MDPIPIVIPAYSLEQLIDLGYERSAAGELFLALKYCDDLTTAAKVAVDVALAAAELRREAIERHGFAARVTASQASAGPSSQSGSGKEKEKERFTDDV